MTLHIPAKDPFFIPFEATPEANHLPERFMVSSHEPHPLCLLASGELQHYLKDQEEWEHNVGLSPEAGGVIIGKMFGVLVVKTSQQEIGYLASFSGKLAGGNHHTKFVPPVFDTLTENGFLNKGMEELTAMNDEIRKLEDQGQNEHDKRVSLLKTKRRSHSAALQKKIFDHYRFLSRSGEEKTLYEIFQDASYKNPPAGAGECAAPKLLQYAFLQKMQPLAMAEFWWGQSPKSDFWKHGHFYPSCREKCEPILAHMLAGIDG